MRPNGDFGKKRVKNRKVGYKSHGHTIFKGTDWESSFEGEFQRPDDAVARVIPHLMELKPFGRTPREFFKMIRMIFKADLQMKSICNYYHLDEETHRNLLLIIFSILIRSPSSRSQFESYPKMVGLPPDEEIGKMNMAQNYRLVRRRCESGLLSNQYFILIHSPLKKFIFGDGHLDWLTTGSLNGSIQGRAILPLTPHLAVYICTPRSMRTKPNCASFSAAPWIVDWINELTQIYSKNQLFYLGRPPKLTDAFIKGEHLVHKKKTDALIDKLDEIAGIKKHGDIFSFGMSALR